MDWGDFIQQSAGKFLDARLEYDYKAPVDLEKLKLLGYGAYGQPYLEGQPNPYGQNALPREQIPQSWLLIGAVLAVVLLVAD